MRIIKQLADEIAHNIDEAEEKIEMAYRLKAEHPQESSWFKDMSASHLSFNAKAHELVAAQIAAFKNSKYNAEHPEYATGMMAVWSDRHADLMAHSARVKAMIDAFK